MIKEQKTYIVTCDLCLNKLGVFVEKEIPFVFQHKENIGDVLKEFGWYQTEDKIFCKRCTERKLLNKE